MLKKRIISCLDIKNGRTVKGTCFEDLRDAGDPVELAKRYVNEGADELVFLDISATLENRKTTFEMVSRIAAVIDVPFTVGGGITTLEDVKHLVSSGADKVSINSAAVRNPELVSEVAMQFGRQCVVVAIDTNCVNGEWKVFTGGGKTATALSALNWAREAEQLGAGEILLTSMKNDGTKSGFALDITAEISKSVGIPVIASGGAGCAEDFSLVFSETCASAALAAGIFHFGELSIPELKQYLKNKKIPVRL